MGEKKTADSGGLDLRSTWMALQLKWNELTDGSPLEATLEEHERLHFQDVELDAIADKEVRHAFVLEQMKNCRICAIGVGLQRLKRYKLHDLPAIHDARGLRQLFKTWNRFAATLSVTYPNGRLADLAEDLEEELYGYEFYVDHSSLALRELNGTGRPRSHLAKGLLELLVNGGFGWDEIVQLVKDGGGIQGLEKRLRKLHRARLRETGRLKSQPIIERTESARKSFRVSVLE